MNSALKKIGFCLVLSLLIFPATFGQGINFFNGDLNDAIAEGKAQKKPVFVYCYTTWCGPCKNMTSNVLPNQKVGDFFNQNYICLKMNMEEGEGKTYAKLWNISAFPEFAVLDEEGFLNFKDGGGVDADAFISIGKEGLKPDNTLGVFTREWNSGNRNKFFLSEYIKLLYKFDQDLEEPLIAYFQDLSTKELSEAEHWDMFKFAINDPEHPFYTKILNESPDIQREIGLQKLAGKLYKDFSLQLSVAITLKDYEKQERLKSLLTKSKFPEKEFLKSKIELESYLKSRDYGGFARIALVYLKMDPDEKIKNLGFAIQEIPEWLKVTQDIERLVQDSVSLAKTAEWLKLKCQKDSEYAALDMYARILNKQGDKTNARIQAQNAIEIAKSKKIGYSATSEFLKKLETE